MSDLIPPSPCLSLSSSRSVVLVRLPPATEESPLASLFRKGGPWLIHVLERFLDRVKKFYLSIFLKYSLNNIRFEVLYFIKEQYSI